MRGGKHGIDHFHRSARLVSSHFVIQEATRSHTDCTIPTINVHLVGKINGRLIGSFYKLDLGFFGAGQVGAFLFVNIREHPDAY